MPITWSSYKYGLSPRSNFWAICNYYKTKNQKTVITKYDDSSLVRSNDISAQLTANIVNCFLREMIQKTFWKTILHLPAYFVHPYLWIALKLKISCAVCFSTWALSRDFFFSVFIFGSIVYLGYFTIEVGHWNLIVSFSDLNKNPFIFQFSSNFWPKLYFTRERTESHCCSSVNADPTPSMPCSL